MDQYQRTSRIPVRRFRRIFNTLFTFELNHDETNSTFLASMGRSGSTWVKDILNYRRDCRVIHEPFHPYRNKLVKHFQYYQYIHPSNRCEEFLAPVRSILSGRIRNTWTDWDNATIFSRKRLIKDIRANLLLKWLHVNFPTVPIILLFRHPCAVASSWLKLGWGMEERGTKRDIDVCLSQNELMKDFFAPFRANIQNVASAFERHIFLWCMLYYVPLRQFNDGEVHLAFYENFCANPQEEIQRLMKFLRKDFDEKILKKLQRASSVTLNDSAIRVGGSLIDGWRDHIPSHQVEKAIQILSLFGLDRIYSKSSMPNVGAAYQLLKEH